MRVIQMSATAGPDGLLHLAVPVGSAGGEFEVAVVVQPGPSVNGEPGHKPTPEELGWSPEFVQNVMGSIDDDTFVRPPQPTHEPVPPLDLE